MQNKRIIKVLSANKKRKYVQANIFYDQNNNIKVHLNDIETMSRNLRMKKMAIANNDAIFQTISLEEFKRISNLMLKELQIIIYEPARITNGNDIMRIISENHDTPTGEHVGVTRLLKKLRTKVTYERPRSEN